MEGQVPIRSSLKDGVISTEESTIVLQCRGPPTDAQGRLYKMSWHARPHPPVNLTSSPDDLSFFMQHKCYVHRVYTVLFRERQPGDGLHVFRIDLISFSVKYLLSIVG
jgi:hypothetical protein